MNSVAQVVPNEIQSTTVMSPMSIIQLAVDKNFDLDRIEKLMAISEQWRKIQAEQAFNQAIAAFKVDPPQVIKDAKNKQYDSMYATIGNIVNTINPALAKHGLSASWDPSQKNGIEVTCILEHVLGHKKKVTMGGPLDKSGAKNELQQIRSTMTYLKVATFEAVTGIVACNEDDDGNAYGKRNKQETPAPEGFERWSDDLRAVVDEGSERLLDVWKKSPMPMRSYMAKNHTAQWEEMKRKAVKVTQKAQGGAQ